MRERQLVRFKTEQEKDEYFLEVIKDLTSFMEQTKDPFSYFLGDEDYYCTDVCRKSEVDGVQYYDDYSAGWDRSLDYSYMVKNNTFPKNEILLDLVKKDLIQVKKNTQSYMWDNYKNDMRTMGITSKDDITPENLLSTFKGKETLSLSLVNAYDKEVARALEELEKNRSIELYISLMNDSFKTDEYIYCQISSCVEEHKPSRETLYNFFDEEYYLPVSEKPSDILKPIKSVVETLLTIF